MLDKAFAIFVRDARLALSYRLWFTLQWLGIGGAVTSLWFVSKLVPASNAFGFNGKATSYFEFAIVNVAFLTFQTTALQSFDRAIRDDQLFGTLESTLVTPTSVRLIVLGSGLWAFTLTSLNVACYLIVSFLFGMRLPHVDVPGAVAVLLLTVGAIVPLGILSAAGVMVLKQGAPVQYLLNMAATLFAGVLFPVSLLPSWLQGCSWLLPATHALSGIRAALHGATFVQLAPDLLWLLVVTIASLPFALWVFRCAVVRAKMDGSLAQY